MRSDGRQNSELRPVEFVMDYTKYAEGSVLIKMGGTWVLCNATVSEKVPLHKKGSGEGWVTAEYSMLPRATQVRNQRDIAKLKLSSRSAEIQRLIGRSLRSVTDLKRLGERTVIVDCDVLQADGGTRCASVTGGCVALYLACRALCRAGAIEGMPLRSFVAAVSAGLKGGGLLLDLSFEEDKETDVDLNLVADEQGRIIELQATGEQAGFSQEELNAAVALCKEAANLLIARQKAALEGIDN